jgi:hypothetical protein
MSLQPRLNTSRCSVVGPRQVRDRQAFVELFQQLEIFIFRPGFAGVRRQAGTAGTRLGACGGLQRPHGYIQRANHIGGLIWRVDVEHLAGLRVDAVRQRGHDAKGFDVIHDCSLHDVPNDCDTDDNVGAPGVTNSPHICE